MEPVPTRIEYYLFREAADLDGAWAADLVGLGIVDSGPACFNSSDHVAGSWTPYTFPDEPEVVGRIACRAAEGGPVVVVAVDVQRILMRIDRAEGTTQQLMDWWIDKHPGPCRGIEPC